VYPPRVNITHEVLDRHVAGGRGDRTAVVWGSGRWTYRELQDEVNRLSVGFRRIGIGRNSKVLFRTRNLPQAIAAILAAYRLAAVPVWVNSLLQESELEYIADNSEARVAVTMAELAEPLRNLRSRGFLDSIVLLDAPVAGGPGEHAYESLKGAVEGEFIREDTAADDPAFMLYSSGTTGRPKGILHAHRWIIAVGDPALVQTEYVETDIVMTSSEFSFMGTFAHALHFVLYAGATIAIYGERARPDEVFAAIERNRATVFMSVPTLFRASLAREGLAQRCDLSSLRMVISTGESLGASTYEQWMSTFKVPLIEVYGVSEVEVLIGNSPAFPVRPGSIGKALPGFRLSLLDRGLEPVGTDEEGVLMIHRSDPGLYLTYYRAPERWRAQHRGEWYYTGDVMRRDKDGYYWYVGRDDDLFKSRGYFLSPQEIENAVIRHPKVAEVAVVGVPDPTIGNRVAAFVVPVEGAEPSDALREDIIEFTRGQIAAYKVPKDVEFIDAIPKNPVGKILRRELRGRIKS
jgi:acyl-coenzyme A synthetase/AMP-(fatty) acid ligase